MIENKQAPQVLNRLTLANGVHVSIYDMSKRLAADRWQVKVKCEAVCSLKDSFFAASEDSELVSLMKERFSEGICYSFVKERTFIDENRKKEVLDAILSQLQKNTMDYLASENFPQKLFVKEFESFKKEYLLKKQMEQAAKIDEEDEAGPADFSACFRD